MPHKSKKSVGEKLTVCTSRTPLVQVPLALLTIVFILIPTGISKCTLISHWYEEEINNNISDLCKQIVSNWCGMCPACCEGHLEHLPQVLTHNIATVGLDTAMKMH